ncbi:helix-turn-helix domain-containing protein [Streptomyces purpurogeneiscleroticus]|uniref:helix-turn-helix domain-containing protein n=1 Tax=Streptomyces purpurogeneiscleroticus TaxID=68259 RepID=UPI001CBFFE1E|nr:helix-turn-helix transcriptional regulator [Streptomyces purpurogeneiscleroticus]MBZ4019389.1 transcriptional regulator [Streptomyces purpurogeneiscleroticus]
MQPRNHPSRRKNATTLRLVGAQLALFRRLSGLTQRELSDRLNVGEETIASIEQGRRPLKGDLAERLDLELGTRGVLAVAVEYMPEIEKFPVWAAEFIDYEREAIAHYSYENQVFPGLLQTKPYAYAVFRNEIPLLDETEIEERVAARIERQSILHRKAPTTVSFILYEAVLREHLGGDAELHAEQLRHTRACADLPGVTIQVMPFGRPTHTGLSGPFVLLETPDHVHLAYSETQRGGQLISDQDEVSVLARKYAMLRTEALTPEETKSLLDRLLGEL